MKPYDESKDQNTINNTLQDSNRTEAKPNVNKPRKLSRAQRRRRNLKLNKNNTGMSRRKIKKQEATQVVSIVISSDEEKDESIQKGTIKPEDPLASLDALEDMIKKAREQTSLELPPPPFFPKPPLPLEPPLPDDDVIPPPPPVTNPPLPSEPPPLPADDTEPTPSQNSSGKVNTE